MRLCEQNGIAELHPTRNRHFLRRRRSDSDSAYVARLTEEYVPKESRGQVGENIPIKYGRVKGMPHPSKLGKRYPIVSWPIAEHYLKVPVVYVPCMSTNKEYGAVRHKGAHSLRGGPKPTINASSTHCSSR